ncbi:MAG: M20/M25/M40 family metallo-hydrolase, partial [Anaerovoracaceae bacterium]
DGVFPVINQEMGIIIFDLARKFQKQGDKGLRLKSIKGGKAPNMVADSARVIVQSSDKFHYEEIRGIVASLRAEKEMKIACKVIGKSMEITTEGISAHGARPYLGKNAISMIMEFLGELTFESDDINDFIKFYNEYIGYDLKGKKLLAQYKDNNTEGNVSEKKITDDKENLSEEKIAEAVLKHTTELTNEPIVNVGMIEMDLKSARLTINIRYPVEMTDIEVYEKIAKSVDKFGIGIIKRKHQLPINMPEDHELIVKLMEVYKEYTGDNDSKLMCIGGGTYARAFKNHVAFGGQFIYEEDCAHQKDEYIKIENLFLMKNIYKEAIKKLTS